MEEIVTVHGDEAENFIAVGIGGMETVVIQDNGIETSHGTTMGDISMDDGAAAVEGAEACQGEPTIEDCSVSNGTIDADGAQSHGAERVSGAHGAQLVGGSGSMVSGGIVGAGVKLCAAEDVGEEVDNVPVSKKKKKKKKKKKRGKRSGQQKRLGGNHKQNFQRQRDEAS